MPSPRRELISFRSFELDLDRREILRAGQAVHVTPKAFDLLALLIDSAPRVVPKRELHDRLWPRVVVSDWTLFGLVKEVRRALDDRDKKTPLIRTVHRVGYAFNAPLERTSPRSRRSRHWLVLNGSRLPLVRGDNVVGRDPDAEVWLDDATVSRRHARIVIGDGGALLEDLGSKNGTSLKQTRLEQPVTLRDGDELAFGDVPALYRESTAGASTVSRTSRTQDARSR
jgi:DNA-binding winged helix-turn-helix (wHTH) protein